MRRLLYSVAALTVLFAVSGCRSDGGSTNPSTQPPAGPVRAFHFGLTPFPHDVTLPALDFAYEAVKKNGDLVAHHFDTGIPWNEALDDIYPYDAHIMDDWQTRKLKTPAGHTVYVGVTPINTARDAMALYRKTGDDMALIAPFAAHAAGQRFNDTQVKTAYLNYCKRVISYFNPSYFAIGIEVNLLRRSAGQAVWNRYVELNQHVYTQLKALYPKLPIFVSIAGQPLLLGFENPVGEFGGDPQGYRASQVAALNDVSGANDYYAISFYPYISPYLGSLYPAIYPSTMFDDLFSLSSKPIAIAETGYPAADINILGTTFVGSQAAQTAYMKKLFEEGEKRKFKFIVNFVPRDYTALCQTVGCPQASYLWETTGIYDAAGNGRSSQKFFEEYKARTYKP